MTIIIPLTQGQVTIVDDEDADLAEFKWYAAFNPSYSNGGAFIAVRHLPMVHGKRSNVTLHRFMDKGEQVFFAQVRIFRFR